MRTLDSALPPAPLAVSVYVVDVDGLTVVDPCTDTLPTPGLIEAAEASLVFHESCTDSPWLIVVWSALNVALGFVAGAGAGAGGFSATCFFWQPAMNRASTEAEMSIPRPLPPSDALRRHFGAFDVGLSLFTPG